MNLPPPLPEAQPKGSFLRNKLTRVALLAALCIACPYLFITSMGWIAEGQWPKKWVKDLNHYADSIENQAQAKTNAGKLSEPDYSLLVSGFIMDNTNDPKSYQPAKFQIIGRLFDEQLGDSAMLVYHTYRAKNGFGALVLTEKFLVIDKGNTVHDRTSFILEKYKHLK